MAVGIMGKLPTNGDFVRRRVPAELAEPLDAWLAQALAASREQLGEGWLDTYLTAPVWRFALAAGCCGPAAAGIWLPSVDKVGRYFPCVLVAAFDGAPPPTALPRAATAVVRSPGRIGPGHAGGPVEPRAAGNAAWTSWRHPTCPRSRPGCPGGCPSRPRRRRRWRPWRRSAASGGAKARPPCRPASWPAPACPRPPRSPPCSTAASAGTAGRSPAHDRLPLGRAQPCRPCPPAQRGQRRRPARARPVGGRRRHGRARAWRRGQPAGHRELGPAAADRRCRRSPARGAGDARPLQPRAPRHGRPGRPVGLHRRGAARRRGPHRLPVGRRQPALPPARRPARSADPGPQPGAGAGRPGRARPRRRPHPPLAQPHHPCRRHRRAAGARRPAGQGGARRPLPSVQRRPDRRAQRTRRSRPSSPPRRPRPRPTGCSS